jgi:hypothetical protein
LLSTWELRAMTNAISMVISPERYVASASMGPQSPIFRDEGKPMFDRRGEDDPIRWVARERRREGHRRVGDGRRRSDRPDRLGKTLQPRPDRDPDDDAVMTREPRQFEPRDRRDRELIGAVDHGTGGAAQSIRLRGPPVENV